MKYLKYLFSLLVFTFSLLAHASLGTPVTISSITVSSGVATVTTSSVHNIPNANNMGFCILGVVTQTVDNVCGTAATVPSTTTLTFNAPNGITLLACASSCGTLQPSPLFVVKGNIFGCIVGKQCVTYCEYNFVAVGLPLSGGTTNCAGAFTTSAFGANASTILSEMNAAIAAGQIIETFHSSEQFPSSYNATQIQNKILDIQFADQVALGASNGPGSFIGKACDVTGCN